MEKIKYEFFLYEGNQTMVDRDMEWMQNDGWELAGQISILPFENESSRLLIPLKRQIEKP